MVKNLIPKIIGKKKEGKEKAEVPDELPSLAEDLVKQKAEPAKDTKVQSATVSAPVEVKEEIKLQENKQKAGDSTPELKEKIQVTEEITKRINDPEPRQQEGGVQNAPPDGLLRPAAHPVKGCKPQAQAPRARGGGHPHLPRRPTLHRPGARRPATRHRDHDLAARQQERPREVLRPVPQRQEARARDHDLVGWGPLCR